MSEVVKTSQIKLNVWIFHGYRPGWRLLDPMKDSETKELTDLKKDFRALQNHPSAAAFTRKQHAAESLPYDEGRYADMLSIEADEEGDFIIEDGHVAKQVWDRISKAPEPKPKADPRNPDFPKVPELAKK